MKFNCVGWVGWMKYPCFVLALGPKAAVLLNVLKRKCFLDSILGEGFQNYKSLHNYSGNVNTSPFPHCVALLLVISCITSHQITLNL